MESAFSRHKYFRAGFVAVFAVVSTFLIIHSHAATIITSFEAENGTTANGASVVTDGSASAGQAIKFSSCQVSTILVNPCRAWLGGTATNYPETTTDTKSQILYHESRLGRQLDIVHTYHAQAHNSLTATDTYFATPPNTVLFANWKPGNAGDSWATIASGADDSEIIAMANSIKALGSHKIFLTIWHEPENDVTSDTTPTTGVACNANITSHAGFKGTAGTTTDYVNMWKHVQTVFAADGTTNVVWALDYMNYAPWDCLVPDLYPGLSGSEVDWVVFNAYDNGASATFNSVAGRFYNLLTADTDSTHPYTSKPWGIVEWGSTGLTTAQEEAYFDSAKTALDANTFPNLKLYMIFDENDQGSSTGTNLRVGYDDDGTVDPAKGAHYYNFANDPLLTGSWTGN